MPLIVQITIGAIILGVGIIFILAIMGGKRCPHCDRHQEDDQKCICEKDDKS
jgi:hypothetical protein